MKNFNDFIKESVSFDNRESIAVKNGDTGFSVTAPIAPQSPNGSVTLSRGRQWDEYQFSSKSEWNKFVMFMTSNTMSISFEGEKRSINLRRSNGSIVAELKNSSFTSSWVSKIPNEDASRISSWVEGK